MFFAVLLRTPPGRSLMTEFESLYRSGRKDGNSEFSKRIYSQWSRGQKNETDYDTSSDVVDLFELSGIGG